jgi:hypothetical protein
VQLPGDYGEKANQDEQRQGQANGIGMRVWDDPSKPKEDRELERQDDGCRVEQEDGGDAQALRRRPGIRDFLDAGHDVCGSSAGD